MTATTSAAPLPADLEALMRGLRLPHARAIAADVLATARAQRWDPSEVVKALLSEEAAGRARSIASPGAPTGRGSNFIQTRRPTCNRSSRPWNTTITSLGRKKSRNKATRENT